jgi:hypothetical protein
MSEAKVSEEDVRREHLESVHEGAHWAYLFGVLLAGTVLMLLFIAMLGAGGS